MKGSQARFPRKQILRWKSSYRKHVGGCPWDQLWRTERGWGEAEGKAELWYSHKRGLSPSSYTYQSLDAGGPCGWGMSLGENMNFCWGQLLERHRALYLPNFCWASASYSARCQGRRHHDRWPCPGWGICCMFLPTELGRQVGRSSLIGKLGLVSLGLFSV